MSMSSKTSTGLYRSEFGHDSCGIGFVANLKGKQSHEIIQNALTHADVHGTPWRYWLRR